VDRLKREIDGALILWGKPLADRGAPRLLRLIQSERLDDLVATDYETVHSP